MGSQSLKWDAVLSALCSAGVPEQFGVRIVAILADAGFETRAPLCRPNGKSRGAFVPVIQLERSLMNRMEAEQSCLETSERQDGYRYARLAVLQRAQVEGR